MERVGDDATIVPSHFLQTARHVYCFWLDSDGVVVACNNAASDLCGGAVGGALWDYLTETDASFFTRLTQRIPAESAPRRPPLAAS